MILADIRVEAGDWPAAAGLQALADRAIAAVLAEKLPAIAGGAEVSLVFTDDAYIRRLNRQYRQQDKATNVLSFPAGRLVSGLFGPPLGDIVLARETIAAEAEDYGIPLDNHLIHLIVHGFLHLIGYDHEIAADAAMMESLETAILARLGIADPHAGTDG